MTRPLATQYAELLAVLSKAIMTQWAWPSPESGFALFALDDMAANSPLPPIDQWPDDDRLTHAPSLATAGYAMACGLASEQRASWLSGIERLRRREAFPSDRQSFAYRPVELLGIAAGIGQQTNERSLRKWISEVLVRSRSEHGQQVWSKALQYAAERLTGIAGGRFPALEDCERLDELAALWWLSRRFGVAIDEKHLAQRILERGALNLLDGIDLARAAITFRAIRDTVREVIESDVDRHWQIGRETKDAVELVVHLCRRFHLFSEQIRQRHDSRQTLDVRDEYDVQDALHALLKLHFDDVRPEEVTPSLGGKSGRMDFLLKRERVVVEAKMTRRGLNQKKVGDELIIDMKRYQSHPDVGTLVCFVYDPGGYCNSPTALEADLSGTEGQLRTVVVVCPKGL